MNKLLIFKTITSDKEAGFTTFEILISLLIALGFVAVSMQSLVYAMAMRVQAQEKQRANELIQEDIERINRLGSNATLAGTCNSATYTGSYAEALWNSLQTAAPGTETTTSASLRKTLIKKVNSSGATQTQGKTLGLRRFHISSIGTNSTAPHRTLKVGYQVWNWDSTNFKNKNDGTITTGDKPIAETYVEIIPDVALRCP